MLSSLHDPFLITHLDEFNSRILRAGEEECAIDIVTDGSADALAAAAIIRSLLVKLGALSHTGGQRDLFNGANSKSRFSLRIGGGAMNLMEDRKTITVSAKQAQPTYPFPGLSLSGLALKVADAAFISGALDFPADFVAFDFETTGRDPKSDDIIEIGAVKFRGDSKVDVFSSFVNSRRPIPQEVEGITHISNEMVKGAPRIESVLPDFIDFCGEMPLVAHNIPFDLAFLKRDARLLMGREVNNDTEDTLTMSRWLYPNVTSHRLGAMAEFLGIRLAKWHRAEDDSLAASSIYINLKSGERRTLRELRLKHYLEIASLGTISSGLTLNGENEVLVKYGLSMMLKLFGLGRSYIGVSRQETLSRNEIPAKLLSLDDTERRQAALFLMVGLIEAFNRRR